MTTTEICQRLGEVCGWVFVGGKGVVYISDAMNRLNLLDSEVKLKDKKIGLLMEMEAELKEEISEQAARIESLAMKMSGMGQSGSAANTTAMMLDAENKDLKESVKTLLSREKTLIAEMEKLKLQKSDGGPKARATLIDCLSEFAKTFGYVKQRLADEGLGITGYLEQRFDYKQASDVLIKVRMEEAKDPVQARKEAADKLIEGYNKEMRGKPSGRIREAREQLEKQGYVFGTSVTAGKKYMVGAPSVYGYTGDIGRAKPVKHVYKDDVSGEEMSVIGEHIYFSKDLSSVP